MRGIVIFTSLAENIDTKTLTDIHTLENGIGCPLLAFTFHDVEPIPLNEKNLAKIKIFEESRCICLLAVKP